MESFEKFYVQLDMDKAALVEEAIANFDTGKVSGVHYHNVNKLSNIKSH